MKEVMLTYAMILNGLMALYKTSIYVKKETAIGVVHPGY